MGNQSTSKGLSSGLLKAVGSCAAGQRKRNYTEVEPRSPWPRAISFTGAEEHTMQGLPKSSNYRVVRGTEIPEVKQYWDTVAFWPSHDEQMNTSGIKLKHQKGHIYKSKTMF